MKAMICSIMAALILAGCNAQEKTDSGEVETAASSLEADEALFTQAAENLVGQYSQALRTTLMNALNNSGPAFALYECRLEAPGLTAAHSAEGWSIKRVSEKWRNVTGRPDTTEVGVLGLFANRATREDHTVSWTGPDSARVFHYYQKIVVSAMCVQCHGDLQTVDLDLWKKVKVAYPWDKATGYKPGDLRGMYVVKAPYPAGMELAQLLADGLDITELTAVDTIASDTIAADTVAGDTQ